MISKKYSILAGISLFAIQSVYAHEAITNSNPDSTLYTTYTLFKNGDLDWLVCGSTKETTGCYASGLLGTFTSVGGIIEGLPSVNGNVVTRAIYVVDSSSSNTILYVYKKVDTVTAQNDDVVVTLTNTINLPLVGGKNVNTYIAANDNFLFIGTSLSQQAVEINKSDLSIVPIGGVSPPANVTGITANQYGYITVVQGSAFYLFGPNGEFEEDGGGTDYVAGTTQGIVPLVNTLKSAPKIGFQVKK